MTTLRWLRLAANDALLAAEATDVDFRAPQSTRVLQQARELLATVEVFVLWARAQGLAEDET